MAIQKIPYSTLLQNYGATHRWPFTGSTLSSLLGNELFNGPGNNFVLGDSINRVNNNDPFDQFTFQSKALFGGLQEAFFEDSVDGNGLELRNVAAHVTDQALSAWSLIWFVGFTNSGDGGNITIGGSLHTPFGGSFGDGVLHAMVYDDNAGEFKLTQILNGTASTTSVAGTVDGVGDIGLASHNGGYVLGELAFFEQALTIDQLKTIDDQRRFFGTISGTATVDGQGSPATIRAFTRQDGWISGETTAASDGSYTLFVRDPSEMDILATPPAGIAARPLAHGPILPIAESVG